MLDVKPEIVEELKKLNIGVYYELFTDSSTEIPCISYYEYKNSDDKTAEEFGYSNVGITITIWTNHNDVETNMDLAQHVDKIMRNLGYRRRTCNELIQGPVLKKVIDYEGLGYERY